MGLGKGVGMAVHCVFYTPGNRESCQVLRLVGASPVMRQTRRQLEQRYCRCGRFIACPIFNRVECSLDKANQLRTKAPPSVGSTVDLLAVP